MFSKYRLLVSDVSCFCSKRWKKSVFVNYKGRNKVESTDRALEHFDDFYQPLFKKSWPSIRLGLLTNKKFIAVLNNYSDVESVQTSLENEGALSISRLFDAQSSKIKDKKKKTKDKNVKDSTKLESLVARIGEEKLEKEFENLYSEKGTFKDRNLNDVSDRYIDPSVSVSQLYEYVPATELKGSEDYVRESTHFAYYSINSDLPVSILSDDSLPIPKNLHLYTFEPGNTSSFKTSKNGTTGVSDYLLIDGGSLLPVLALDLQPGDLFLDMCAAPGGKSFLALQTLCPDLVVCNDLTEGRTNRILKMMKEFLYDFNSKVNKGEIRLTQEDARTITNFGYFNKILVDVPCTTDRHSVTVNDNNIFKPTRLKERVKLPELQSELLINALRLVAVGGTVVYSTCSLSPIQNDGVVHMALKKMVEETDSEIAVVDMTKALEPTKIIFRYGNIGLHYGHLVVPYIVSNFGPTYFCKLIKLK